MSYSIRPAQPTDADRLTALMRRSKAHWGYSAEFMQMISQQMQITAQHIEAALAVYVLQDEQGHALGFYHLKRKDEAVCWMEDLFIEPHAMGKGYGKLLFDHAVQTAQAAGFREMQWESDPNAESFYQKMGSERIGARQSVIPGRDLPIMRYVFPAEN
jgi:N-acetylglutamate synthase-like GNAT family acetyltransferase